jgi:hypothetical protein
MPCTLTAKETRRIVDLVEFYPDVFEYALETLMGDSNWYCDARYSEDKLAEHREEMCQFEIDEAEEDVASYEATVQVAGIIKAAKSRAKFMANFTSPPHPPRRDVQHELASVAERLREIDRDLDCLCESDHALAERIGAVEGNELGQIAKRIKEIAKGFGVIVKEAA